MDCIFCKIINGEIPSSKVFENKYVLAFNDIMPQANFHAVVIPKIHIESANEITENNSFYIAKIFEAVKQIADEKHLENGYRVITNCGKHACQSVKHIHFHILAGEQLASKMG